MLAAFFLLLLEQMKLGTVFELLERLRLLLVVSNEQFSVGLALREDRAGLVVQAELEFVCGQLTHLQRALVEQVIDESVI